MAVVKRPIVLCPESFIYPNMPMMSTVAYYNGPLVKTNPEKIIVNQIIPY